tara:strand:- start:3773 stop:4477 length:705 start_codon:yes stop_codon:yes gene_type:complete
MALETAQTHIDAALRKIGITKPSTAQRNNGLEALNDMLSHWSAESLLLLSITTETLTLTAGTREYTIGSSGDFNTTRPYQIRSAFLRDSNNVDFPLNCYTKKEDNRVHDKTSSGRPTQLVYIPSYTLGKIIFNQKPDAAYSFILDSYKPLTELSALSTTVSFPEDYKVAIKFNLAMIMATEEDVTPQAIIQEMAKTSKELIRSLSATAVPEVLFDLALVQSAIKQSSPDITVLR